MARFAPEFIRLYAVIRPTNMQINVRTLQGCSSTANSVGSRLTHFSLSPFHSMKERKRKIIQPLYCARGKSGFNNILFMDWRDCISSIEMWSCKRKTRRLSQQLFNYVAHSVMQIPSDVKTFSVQH